MSLVVRPITQKAARAFLRQHHRHLAEKHPAGWLFGAAAWESEVLVGVVMVGRPARLLQDGFTAQLQRVCSDGTRNVPSFLAARGRRAAAEVGYLRVFSYTQPGESGASMRAAGFRLVGLTKPGDHDRPSRRREKQPHIPKQVWLWEAGPPTPGPILALPGEAAVPVTDGAQLSLLDYLGTTPA